jgi:hypothetical protein
VLLQIIKMIHVVRSSLDTRVVVVVTPFPLRFTMSAFISCSFHPYSFHRNKISIAVAGTTVVHLIVSFLRLCVLLQDERSSGSSSFASSPDAPLIPLQHRHHSRKVVLFVGDAPDGNEWMRRYRPTFPRTVHLHPVNVGQTHSPLHHHLLVQWLLVGELVDFTSGMRRRPCFTNGALI